MLFDPNIDPTHAPRLGGRMPRRDPISQAEAKRRASAWLHTPPSAHLLRTWQLLCVAGVLAAGQLRAVLGVAPRTLRRYTSLHLLDRLPDRHEQLQALGFTQDAAKLRLYCLGAVGLEMAAQCDMLVPTAYFGPKDRVTHDFLAAHALLSVAMTAHARGYTWRWGSRYQATLHQHKRPHIEPDGLLVLTHPETGARRVMLLEFHAEDSARRVGDKVYRYENVLGLGGDIHVDSLEPWLGERRPTVLTCCLHKATYDAYFHDLRRFGSEPNMRWRGILWRDLIDHSHDPLSWLNYRANKFESLLD